ncbi:hypothetical protein OG788_07905 [Streptomyces sp. NBC_00647]|uniref:hypothetical protein n=1 Tax=Streptomyces sp. NBC_00647 TaxID=2975796 RepID=UPI00324C409D
MNEAWGAVVAAVAAGVFGIIGILAGIVVGRRQTADQATVEHGQWLRGQRQEAFVAYLDAWDRVLDALKQVAEDIDEHTHPGRFHPEMYEEELAEYVTQLVWGIYEPSLKLREQLMLLAPQAVEPLADEAGTALFVVQNRLKQWALCAGSEDAIRIGNANYETALTRAKTARRALFTAARATLLTPPSPKRP